MYVSIVNGAVKPLLCILIAGILTETASAHGPSRWELEAFEWRHDQISQVTTSGGARGHQLVDGMNCIVAYRFNFNVRDDFAFDIDETVWLDMEIRLGPSAATLHASYDTNNVTARSGSLASVRMGETSLPISASSNSRWLKLSIPLEHARFANLGWGESDFSLYVSSADRLNREVVLGSLFIRRTHTTPVATEFGGLQVEILDEDGKHTPARLGLYDDSGRMPLPSNDAIRLRNLNGVARVIALGNDLPIWPTRNRNVFYAPGQYRTRLPVGKYELIVAKGPEYRLERRSFEVASDRTATQRITLRRWTDMAAKEWYSGEDHIHYERENAEDDRQLHLFAQAEDLRVSNVINAGSFTKTYFAQYDWQPHSSATHRTFVLVPGQEDPRSFRGHTVLLNMRKPVRDTDRYLLYHQAFENAHALGGLTGYAHFVQEGDEAFNTTAGVALDLPFGLVDFVSILQSNTTPVDTWFDFLNLGYKLTPSAGTDFPFGAVPGTVRNYVKVAGTFTPQAWFDSFKSGRTFVTSGPMLEFRVNGQGMGSELHAGKGQTLVIEGEASLNPDIGELSSLELIEQGVPVETARPRSSGATITLRHEIHAEHGTWFVLRARGRDRNIEAVSAPVYILVDGQGFWKPTEVPSIAARLKTKMRALVDQPPQYEGAENSQGALLAHWHEQRSALQARIDNACAIYDDLAARASVAAAKP